MMDASSRKVVIVGASAAGLRCACRVRRLQPECRVTVVEAGEVFSYGACGLPYVLSGDIEELTALRRTPYGVERDREYFAKFKGVEILAPYRAVAVDPQARTLQITGADGPRELAWDDLVIATGARPRRLPGQPEHERVHTFHVWDDVRPLKIGLMQGEIEHIAIVGAGLVGCELAEAFHSLWGADVTLIEAATTPLPEILDPELGMVVAAHLAKSGVQLLVGAAVSRIAADDEGVTLEVGGRDIRANAVVIAVGVEPNVELAETAGVALGPSGAIRVDDHLATTVANVWAAGDCIECRHVVTGGPAYVPLGSLANRQGRVVAENLCGLDRSFGPIAGAAAVKIFDFNVATTGCTASRLGADGMGVRSTWVSVEDRAHYWPEARLILLTLVYDPLSRRILGVQGAGESGEVAKRIDVATQMIRAGATIDAVVDVEHSYAPPYSPAVDPLAVLGCAAANQVEGIAMVSPVEDLRSTRVLDVRVPSEREARPIEAREVIEIEAGEIRERVDDLPATPFVVVCAHGTRSAEVVRWLRHRGIEVRFLGGGVSWRVRASIES